MPKTTKADKAESFLRFLYSDSKPYVNKEFLDSINNCIEVIGEYRKMKEELDKTAVNVPTSAGVLKAYPNEDPDQPGICVMLQPVGYEDEIDAAFVSVYENSEYALNGERPVDVSIMSYGNATTENYTTKEIIRREDVIAGLGDPR